jgi:hypothetical protein
LPQLNNLLKGKKLQEIYSCQITKVKQINQNSGVYLLNVEGGGLTACKTVRQQLHYIVNSSPLQGKT